MKRKAPATELERLRAERKALSDRIWKIEAEEQQNGMAALVGRFFKYPTNCFSCPEKPSDYWSIYRRVVKNKNGKTVAVSFETDNRGETRVKSEALFLPDQPGWVEIDSPEFYEAWAKARKRCGMLVCDDPLPKREGESS